MQILRYRVMKMLNDNIRNPEGNDNPFGDVFTVVDGGV